MFIFYLTLPVQRQKEYELRVFTPTRLTKLPIKAIVLKLFLTMKKSLHFPKKESYGVICYKSDH